MTDEVKDEVKDRDEKSGKFLPGNRAQSAKKPVVETSLSDLLEKRLVSALNDKGASPATSVQLIKAGVSFESLQLRKKKAPLVLEPVTSGIVQAVYRLQEKLPPVEDVNMVLDTLDSLVDEFEPPVVALPALPSNPESAKPVPEPVVQRPSKKEPEVDMAAWAAEMEASQKK
jgi:hypothetical protein